MQIRFLLGPAGSGKTFRCLAEIRDALLSDPDGPPLILLAPKQATFQLERQLLSDPAVPGYTRLQILSFERLADFVLGEFSSAPDDRLEEEGRVMALRALLGRQRSKLKVFPASARLPGFAQQLSLLLREFQRQQISPEQLALLSERVKSQPTLANKLHDVGLLLGAYLEWLRTHQLQDANGRLDLAAGALRKTLSTGDTRLHVGGLWLDGFAEMTPQELDLLTAFLPVTDRATLAFCLDGELSDHSSWLSGWSVVDHAFRQCEQRVAAIPGCHVVIESLKRDPVRSRFKEQPALRHLEKSWTEPDGRLESSVPAAKPQTGSASAVRLAVCADPEAEAMLAAREILRFVREGGRFREAAVLVRRLDDYHDLLRRVFARYEIPLFLDRREPVAHHPLAELTRCALRLAAFGWQHDDWFGALKTGLASDDEAAIDRVENEALARGWQGNAWVQPLTIDGDAGLEQSIQRWQQKVLPPFVRWNDALSAWQRRPTGTQLAGAIRDFWEDAGVSRTLEKWSESAGSGAPAKGEVTVHLTVLEQMQDWLDNVERAFRDDPLPLAEWLPILEAGLANLSVGVIPPALDQVLIGAIDRSRNPDLKLAILPGWNETIFPAVPAGRPLLTETERDALAGQNCPLGPDRRQQIGHERYYAYIACTRSSQRLLITCAAQDGGGQLLNPSPFFDRVRQLTGVTPEMFGGENDWRESEHAWELAAPVLRAQAAGEQSTPLSQVAEWPGLSPLVHKWRQIEVAGRATRLAPASVQKIYGRELRSSVSGLEDFAACVFKFFAGRGLHLQERREFQFDDRDKGSFQHEVLREFHRRVRESNARWRDLEPAAARELIVRIGHEMLPGFAGGRFMAGGAARFTGEYLIERLGRLISTLVEWMPQYSFDPAVVEISFGLPPEDLPPWRIELPGDRALVLRGRIDRVDICRTDDGAALAVVMDYKSSARSLNPTRLYHGLDLQLLSYLGVLRHLANPQKFFNAAKLSPAGVFYVPLNGGGARPAATRAEVLAGSENARRAGYQHSGRFLADALQYFDNRGGLKGDQFKFARNKSDGAFSSRGNEAMPSAEFEALREKVEGHLRDYGRRIFEGEVDIAPFRIGKEIACDRCDFRVVCRFDPWTQSFRELRPPPKSAKPSKPSKAAGGKGT